MIYGRNPERKVRPVRRVRNDPCMSCGNNRNELPPDNCLHKANHLSGYRLRLIESEAECGQWKGLALRLYRLMGEEGERLLPGDLESTELLRAALDEQGPR